MSVKTEVCSLRDRGEPQDRDVLCTRPGPWGNPFTLEQWGYNALDLYWLNLVIGLGRRPALKTWRYDLNRREVSLWFRPFSGLADGLRSLAGKRLLCTCPSDLACHLWILADVVRELTGVPVRPVPGRER